MNIIRNRDKGELYIDQSDYILQVLKKFRMDDAKPVKTPMEVDVKPLIVEDKEKQPFSKTVPYQEVIGCLLYLSQISRPDIIYAVNTLSRFNKNFQSQHWHAAKRVLRYLKGSVNMRLCYSKNSSGDLQVFSDSDWGNLINNRYSVSGSCIKFNGGLISWASKKQRTIALSTVEAEYMALSFNVQEIIWLRSLIKEIYPKSVLEPTIVYCDNMGSINLSKNDIVSQKSKHINLRYHFLKEHVKNGDVIIKYLPTDDMLADVLTKPLALPKFVKFTNEFGLIEK
uniref:Copia protein n=2 Tax=Lygus hesperus TaxID=30085 RepID=A0A0A9XU65_LYGHE